MKEKTIEEILTPRKGKIAKSEFADDIVEMLLEGQSYREIERWLEKRGQKISHQAIARFAKKRLKTKHLLPSPIIKEKLKELDVKINEIKDLEALIATQQQRTQKALEKEKGIDFPLSHVTKEMAFLADLYVKSKRLKIEVGFETEKETKRKRNPILDWKIVFQRDVLGLGKKQKNNPENT